MNADFGGSEDATENDARTVAARDAAGALAALEANDDYRAVWRIAGYGVVAGRAGPIDGV